MIKTIKRMLMSLSVLSLLLTPVLVPVSAHAQIQEGLRCGSELQPTGLDGEAPTDCKPDDGSGDPTTEVQRIVKLVINIFSWIVGVIAVFMIIIGGMKYITSGGDSGNITSAKNTILFAVIGLVVVALAQFIVRFVLEQVTTNT